MRVSPVNNFVRPFQSGRFMLPMGKVATMIMLVALLGVAPYFQGEFFPSAQDIAAIAWILWALTAFYRLKHHDVRLTLVDIAIIVYAVFYVIGPSHAADSRLAWQGTWTSLACLAAYYLGRVGSRHYPTWVRGAWGVVNVAGLWITVVGVANAWHQLPFSSAYSATNHTIALSSVFQYHNTLAAFDVAIWLGNLALLALRTPHSRRWWAWSIVCGVTWSGVALSQSRGAWIVGLVVWVFLLVIWPARRVRWILVTTGTTLGALPGLFVLHHAMVTSSAVFGWMGIALIMAGAAGGTWLVDGMNGWFTERRNQRILMSLFGTVMGVGAVIVGTVEGPHVLHVVHIASAQADLNVRLMLWSNAWPLIWHSPWWGWGAGAWWALYQMVRSQPYMVTQVHSFVVQTALDAGIIAGGALLVATVSTIRTLFRSDPSPYDLVAGVVVVTLMAHAAADWDMSFLYVRTLWFGGLGVVSSMTRPLMQRPFTGWKLWAARGIVTLAGGAMVLMAATAWWSLHWVRVAQRTSSGSAGQLQALRQATTWAPYNGQIAEIYAQSLWQKGSASNAAEPKRKALNWFERAAKLSPYNASDAEHVAIIAFQLGQPEQAYSWAQRASMDSPRVAYYFGQWANAGALWSLKVLSTQPQTARTVADRVLARGRVWQHPGAQRQGTVTGFNAASLAALAVIAHNQEAFGEWIHRARHSAQPGTRELAQLLWWADHPAQRPDANAIQHFLAQHPAVDSSASLLSPLFHHEY